MSKLRKEQQLSRRSFIRRSGALGATLSASAFPLEAAGQTPRVRASAEQHPVSVSVDGDTVTVHTSTLSATLRRGMLTSLRPRGSTREYIESYDPASAAPLSLVYEKGETVGLTKKFSEVTARSLSPTRAEFIFHNWDGDGVLAVSGDPETGDLLLEPSAYSSRPGVRACRWELRRPRSDLQLVAPFFQGIRLPLEDSLIRNRRWQWPMSWEACMVILEGTEVGFWVHTRDDRYRYKSIQVGSESEPRLLGFDTECYGPLDHSLAAGGLEWRLNVFEGDWTSPASVYRDWLWQSYGLDSVQRPQWLQEIAMAISWCPGETAVLEALAKTADPRKVLIHFPDWRTDAYDENYPTYEASPKGREFIRKAQALGFRIMPHCNAIDMDPSHPVYPRIRDFQYRHLETGRILGWSWYEGGPIGVPESNGERIRHRDKKVMVKIHPGLSMWRAILGEKVGKPASELGLDALFLDVTLTTWNLSNCLVENLTPTEGMKRIIRHVSQLGNGLVVGGEGLNEITFQELAFAQVHLFDSWHSNREGLERTGGCPLNEFLFGRICRSFGYSGLSGSSEEHRLRHRMHQEHHAIPTITIRSAEELSTPNPTVRSVLESAS